MSLLSIRRHVLCKNTYYFWVGEYGLINFSQEGNFSIKIGLCIALFVGKE